ncbi:MAG: magnesium transporter [Rhodospirillales bacterium]
MSDPALQLDSEDQQKLQVVTPEMIQAIVEAVQENRGDDARSMIERLSPAGIAHVLEQMPSDERRGVVQLIGLTLDPEILFELDDDVRDDVIQSLAPKEIAAMATELDSDDAADIIGDLDEDERREVLAQMPAEERANVEESLSYGEDTAGRLMQHELAKVPESWKVGEVIDYFRESADELPEDFYDVFVVDAGNRPVGVVALGSLVRSKRPMAVADIMERDIRTVLVTAPQEDVAHLFRDENLISCPVVDPQGRLVGVITVDDVVDVIDEEAEKDLLSMAGVSEVDIFADVRRTARARFGWLFVNLLTALIASSVIGLFETEIVKIVALAVLAPIVASMGGNAGTQTLTVAVRALAMKELTVTNALRFIGKELIVGSFNAILFALVTGMVAALWFADWRIGAIIGAALIVNMLAAALAGTVIPLTLERMRIDPAVASVVFLTTVTDVVGFFSFLGLAALFLI